MANESGMREYVRGETGTLGEMAVSGQTSLRQGGKWSEVFVRVYVLLLFFHYQGIRRSVRRCGTHDINCLQTKAKLKLTEG